MERRLQVSLEGTSEDRTFQGLETDLTWLSLAIFGHTRRILASRIDMNRSFNDI